MADPVFYDLCVHCVPDGKSTQEEMVAMARHLGFGGIALTNHSNSDSLPKGSSDKGFEILRGVELVSSNPSKLHGLVGKYRKKVDILAVHGGDEGINRAAVENPNVDILLHPGTPKGCGLNHVLAKSASDNNVAIAFDMASLIMLRGGRRVHSLSHFREILALARKYDVPFLLTNNASFSYGLRAPREMMALATLFGMERGEALKSLSETPAEIIRRVRRGNNFICEGVEILEDDPSGMEGEEK
ncbi:ribonuclease P protein component 3 [Methanococcoides sp. NM1]|uniref:ribonuclease P protein component 3 n=1 Tax=Methanococcoides sp. NM1 TaxID=1201013 RepID=UPI001082ABE2|nr:ribonuclease P protein component 3 [Methanococcoides sp. NM1]